MNRCTFLEQQADAGAWNDFVQHVLWMRGESRGPPFISPASDLGTDRQVPLLQGTFRFTHCCSSEALKAPLGQNLQREILKELVQIATSL